jgi:hypothetical protein
MAARLSVNCKININNIRLENGETVNTKQFIESGEKFDDAKIRLSRAFIQSRAGLVI